MGLYEKIKFLASQRKLSIRKLEESLGYGNGTIRRWDRQTPGIDKLEAVANYFDVSVDYLLGRTDSPSLDDATSTAGSDIASYFRINTANMDIHDAEEIEEELKDYFDFLVMKAREKKNQNNK